MRSVRHDAPSPFVVQSAYREKVRQGSRIGKKGYTIPKVLLDPADLRFLCHDLYMIPTKTGPTYGMGEADEQSFPVYRENAQKIYLPRFYGIERYGRPDQDETVPHPIQINCRFEKPLRDYQEAVVGSYLNAVQGDRGKTQGGIITIGCGKGKCLGFNTPVLMYDGTIKAVQDIRVGDQLMGDDSTPRNVLSLARGREPMYRVKGEHGAAEYVVNQSHILSMVHQDGQSLDDIINVYLTDLLLSKEWRSVVKDWYGFRVPIVFPERHLDNDPYEHGKWLTLIESYRILNCPLPRDYMCNSRKNQLAFLAGILDVCARYDFNMYGLRHKNEAFADDVVFLARSLGFVARKKTVSLLGDAMFSVYIYGDTLEEIPVRKREHWRGEPFTRVVGNPPCFPDKYQVTLERLKEDDYYGFEIDGNRRFVLGDFTVTHNTVMAIKIVSTLALKTLIVVHKEFLLNQWVERIQEFLPTARVGRIQGPVFDSAGKDIVIGMLQTLYDRDFPEGALDDFGLTVVDEVHRIGSCQFSKALLRIQTPYMLGVTATLERKDGLTKVIHHFMGPVVYSDDQGLKSDDGSVLVRAMEFVSRDPEFNEVVTDFRGNTQISTMISKLCAHRPRTRFLVNILSDVVQETPEAQILVLGHNRSLLVDLHTAIVEREIATVGYYLGGMKPAQLEVTTEKQIILATYAMAAEGFDHKNLSVLVMVTPKTDIVQSVGRIFRQKHARPLIVDVLDTHDSFKNQWAKRRAYYKKCGFRIHHSVSTEPGVWRCVYEPTLAASKRASQSHKNHHNDNSESDLDSETTSPGCLIPLSHLE